MDFASQNNAKKSPATPMVGRP